jgi:hypothetical protein
MTIRIRRLLLLITLSIEKISFWRRALLRLEPYPPLALRLGGNILIALAQLALALGLLIARLTARLNSTSRLSSANQVASAFALVQNWGYQQRKMLPSPSHFLISIRKILSVSASFVSCGRSFVPSRYKGALPVFIRRSSYLAGALFGPTGPYVNWDTTY